ncbi:MAG: GGDEF domain-containing protein [Gammaproteobacteria bacterium]
MHPDIPGPGRWALAGVSGAIALLLLMLFDAYPLPFSLAIAQLLAAVGLILAWDGFRRFHGQSPLTLRTLAMLVASVLAWLVLAHLEQSILLRAVGNAVLIAGLSGLIARDLLVSSGAVRPAVRATGWIYALNALIFLIRATYIHTDIHGIDPLNPSGISIFMLLWWLCMTIAVTLGMVLMTSERLQAELDIQANLDPLTGAHNRRAFSLLADKEILRARRHNRPLSVLLMDLDNFKRINDHLGHEAGDTLLCLFVSSVQRMLRGEDMFCRFGGEEFVAMMPDTPAELAYQVSERLRKSFMSEATSIAAFSSLSLPITVSIGVAELQRGEDIDALLRRADTALYQAKDKGRNRSELADKHKYETDIDTQISAGAEATARKA